MSYESSRDFKMVLFPPVMLLFFLGGMATPIALILFLLFTPNVGWLFVAERRQGTLKRLQAAPLTKGHILLGKLAPCFAISLAQGLVLLLL